VRPWLRPFLTGAAVVVILTLVAVAVYGRSTGWFGSGRPTTATLAVLPFSAAETDGELAAGLSQAIAERLGSGQHQVPVRSRSSGDQSLAMAADSRESTLLLDGEIQSIGDIVRVLARLRDAASGETIWSDRLQVRATELFSIENVIAERVVDALNLRVAAADQERLRRQYTRNAQAYGDYLRGRAELVHHTPDGTARAIAAFEAALERDPSYALARAGLAMACADMCLRFAPAGEVERWGLRAEAEARAALALDPNLAEAHLARAATARRWEFDWRMVMTASGRALVLNPNLEEAHFFRAAAFYHLGFMEESLIEMQRGRALGGPDVIEPLRVEGVVHLFSGNFAPARAHLEEVSRLSNQPLGETYLALAYYYSGHAERGRAMLEALAASGSASQSARAGAALAGVLAAAGDRAAAREHVDRVLASQYRDHHVAYSLGVAYAQLQDSANADRWLRTAAETGFPCLPWFERDPLLEPLRDRPVFAELMTFVRDRRNAASSDLQP
jgi:TolB-like protein/Flp pilus assembly protein TadD